MATLFETGLTEKNLLERVVPKEYYESATLKIAKEMLGKTLVVAPIEGSLESATAGIIVETEGYVGPEDPACHAYTGLTKRNATMWGAPGNAYVYFTYGNHWMINLVTERDGYPAAVLLRAVEPVHGLELMRARRKLENLKGKPNDRNLTNGPGKMCAAMGINGAFNGLSLQGPHLYIIETPQTVALPPFEMVETTRIGITRGVELPWRYYVKGNKFVSKF
jgi:DNA-3-methyladenine glycosylase